MPDRAAPQAVGHRIGSGIPETVGAGAGPNSYFPRMIVEVPVPDSSMHLDIAYPVTAFGGGAFVLVLLLVLVMAGIKKSCRWSALSVGWAIAGFLYAIGSICWDLSDACMNLAGNPQANLQDFEGGIYRAFIYHVWIVFAAVGAVAAGTWMMFRYWPDQGAKRSNAHGAANK